MPATAPAPDTAGQLLLRFTISLIGTSILAILILDGGEVSKPSIVGTWIVSAIILGVVLIRRGESSATALDRLVVVLSPPIVFILFMRVLPLVWHWRGLS